MDGLYYTPPDDKIFQEVKQKAIEIWTTKDNTYGYVDQKVSFIKEIANFSDNFMYIVAMFDLPNQALLAVKLTPAARLEVRKRIKAGGTEDDLNVFYE